MKAFDNELDDPGYSVLLRRNLGLTDAFNEFLKTLTEEIHSAFELRNRSDAKQVTMSALRVVLGNLYRAHLRDQKLWVALSLSSNDYTAGELNPFGISYRGVDRVVDYLVSIKPPLVSFRPGFNPDNPRWARYSRIRAGEDLIRRINHQSLAASDRNNDTQRLTKDTSNGAALDQSFSLFFEQRRLPTIRLKDEKGQLVEFKPTDVTEEMKVELNSWNEFQRLHWIDLLVRNDEFSQITNYTVDAYSDKETEDPFDDSDDDHAHRVDIGFDRDLYRVFNNCSFEEGGRLYGGWWQNIPRKWRPFLTINWVPTKELDYSNMQAAMLYGIEGQKLEGDAYHLEGVPKAFRNLLKRAFFKLINGKGRIRAPLRRELPEGWSWNQLLNAMREKHSAISKHFNSGIGIKLQRTDADIALRVIRELQAEDTLVLPVHDSFITYTGQADRLRGAMASAYRDAMAQEIGIEVDDSFADLFEDEVQGGIELEDVVYDLEMRPEYSGYLARKADFVSLQTEEWKWRFI